MPQPTCREAGEIGIVARRSPRGFRIPRAAPESTDRKHRRARDRSLRRRGFSRPARRNWRAAKGRDRRKCARARRRRAACSRLIVDQLLRASEAVDLIGDERARRLAASCARYHSTVHSSASSRGAAGCLQPSRVRAFDASTLRSGLVRRWLSLKTQHAPSPHNPASFSAIIGRPAWQSSSAGPKFQASANRPPARQVLGQRNSR